MRQLKLKPGDILATNIKYGTRTGYVGRFKTTFPMADILGISRALSAFNAEHGAHLQLLTSANVDRLIPQRDISYSSCPKILVPVNVFVAFAAQESKRLGRTIKCPYPNGQVVSFPTGVFKDLPPSVLLKVKDLTKEEIKRSGRIVQVRVPDGRVKAVAGLPRVHGCYRSQGLIPFGEPVKSKDLERVSPSGQVIDGWSTLNIPDEIHAPFDHTLFSFHSGSYVGYVFVVISANPQDPMFRFDSLIGLDPNSKKNSEFTLVVEIPARDKGVVTRKMDYKYYPE